MLLAVSGPHVLDGIGRSLREAFFMFWETLWALVLGFTLSGAVQAFVSRDQMRSRLGNHGPKSIGLAALLGAVSSSCSYAASAMARSMVKRGADFLAAMVFMFASTNLVIELGIVLVVLIGWQFVAAEFIGGVIMIVLLASVGALWLRGRHLAFDDQDVHGHEHGPGEVAGSSQAFRVRSLNGWSDAAGYTISDISMLRKEMAIGFVVAGFLSVLVPVDAWSSFFLHGHGWWTSVENVVVGPLVALVSFVCSVGNVPLAAALWKGGSSFGGVVSFIFADLITLPLLAVYRKQYGLGIALRMLGGFWVIMSAAGLATEALFRAAGWVPTSRPTVVSADTLGLNYTTILDVLALCGLSALYILYRRRASLGGDGEYAKDPVCGMQVERRNAPATLLVARERYYFCSERCRDRYAASSKGAQRLDADTTGLRDPICGMQVDPSSAPAHRVGPDGEVWFCSAGCAEEFDRQGAGAPGHPIG